VTRNELAQILLLVHSHQMLLVSYFVSVYRLSSSLFFSTEYLLLSLASTFETYILYPSSFFLSNLRLSYPFLAPSSRNAPALWWDRGKRSSLETTAFIVSMHVYHTSDSRYLSLHYFSYPAIVSYPNMLLHMLPLPSAYLVLARV